MQFMFNNAILQSDPMTIPFRNYAESLLICDYFLKELNCAVGDKACIMNKNYSNLELYKIVKFNTSFYFDNFHFFSNFLESV